MIIDENIKVLEEPIYSEDIEKMVFYVKWYLEELEGSLEWFRQEKDSSDDRYWYLVFNTPLRTALQKIYEIEEKLGNNKKT